LEAALKVIDEELFDVESFALIGLNNDEAEKASAKDPMTDVQALVTVTRQRLPVDKNGVLQELAKKRFGIKPEKEVKVAVIRGLVALPTATRSANLARNEMLLSEVIRWAYAQKRLVAFEFMNVWPRPWPRSIVALRLLPAVPGLGDVSSADVMSYYKGLGFREVNNPGTETSTTMLYTGAAPDPKETSQKGSEMVRIASRGFRETLSDYAGFVR